MEPRDISGLLLCTSAPLLSSLASHNTKSFMDVSLYVWGTEEDSLAYLCPANFQKYVYYKLYWM